MNVTLNCDLGEGAGNDAEIMPLISACNIACGGHAGDNNSMIETLILAKKYGVKIGAHPAYPDKENFGRITVKMSYTELFESLYNQIIFLKNAASKLGLKLNHIKPHGALYNDATKSTEMATIIVEVIKKINPKLTLYAPYHSALATCAEKENMTVTYEAFIDRRYNRDLSLVSRQFKTAVITDADAVFDQLYKLVSLGKVTCLTGETIEIKAATYCIHGDNAKAVSILKNIHKRCEEKNIIIN